jgi:hypothetical protein
VADRSLDAIRRDLEAYERRDDTRALAAVLGDVPGLLARLEAAEADNATMRAECMEFFNANDGLGEALVEARAALQRVTQRDADLVLKIAGRLDLKPSLIIGVLAELAAALGVSPDTGKDQDKDHIREDAATEDDSETPDTRWAIELTCCGRANGFQVCATWADADSFREGYTGDYALGATGFQTIDPHGYSGDGYNGHQRSGRLFSVPTTTRLGYHDTSPSSLPVSESEQQ